jgi:hypothetical protein
MPLVKNEDGSKHMKIRFNIKGPHSGAIVFAEASSALDTKNGEWVYLIVQVETRLTPSQRESLSGASLSQDKATGRVVEICDNRSRLQLAQQAKTPEEKEALMRLLKGSGAGSY